MAVNQIDQIKSLKQKILTIITPKKNKATLKNRKLKKKVENRVKTITSLDLKTETKGEITTDLNRIINNKKKVK